MFLQSIHRFWFEERFCHYCLFWLLCFLNEFCSVEMEKRTWTCLAWTGFTDTRSSQEQGALLVRSINCLSKVYQPLGNRSLCSCFWRNIRRFVFDALGGARALVSWANSSVGVPSCLAPTHRPNVGPDPTPLWCVRALTWQVVSYMLCLNKVCNDNCTFVCRRQAKNVPCIVGYNKDEVTQQHVFLWHVLYSKNAQKLKVDEMMVSSKGWTVAVSWPINCTLRFVL